MSLNEKIKYIQTEDSVIIFNVETSNMVKVKKGLGKVLQQLLPENYTDGQLTSFKKKVSEIENEEFRSSLFGLTEIYEDEQVEREGDNITISFAPIHKCNLRCKYCYADGGRNYKGQEREMDVKTLERVFQFALCEFKPNAKYVVVNLVSGGEPFLGLDLCSEINRIIDSINPELSRKIFIGTNLTIFNQQIIDKLKTINPQLGVSIDGDMASHDCNRVFEDGTGSYETVRQNLLKLKSTEELSKKTRDCLVMTVVNEDNLDLIETLKHHKTLGVSSVQMKVARKTDYSDKGISENNLEQFKQAYEELAAFLLDEFREGRTGYLELVLNTTDYLGKFIHSIMLGEHNIYRCGAGRDKLSFNAEGDIFPCDNFMEHEEYKLGNIFDNAEVDKSFLNYSVDKMEECSKCWARYICSGECHFNSFIHTGKVDKPSKVMCEFFRNNITLAIKLVMSMKETDRKLYNRIVRMIQVRDRNNVIK